MFQHRDLGVLALELIVTLKHFFWLESLWVIETSTAPTSKGIKVLISF